MFMTKRHGSSLKSEQEKDKCDVAPRESHPTRTS